MFPCMPAMLACSQACFASICMPTGMTPISHRPRPALISAHACTFLALIWHPFGRLFVLMWVCAGACHARAPVLGYDPIPIWSGRYRPTMARAGLREGIEKYSRSTRHECRAFAGSMTPPPPPRARTRDLECPCGCLALRPCSTDRPTVTHRPAVAHR
jgi:hypothetical protein